MIGSCWYSNSHIHLVEEKSDDHSGFCLELWTKKRVKLPVLKGSNGKLKFEWEQYQSLVDRITVDEAIELADSLSTWADTMREAKKCATA